jgi:hypothetical protein
LKSLKVKASPGISRTYTADGLLQTIASNGSTWTYSYNALRKPALETLTYAGQHYGLSWSYNTAGDLSTLTYPDNSSVSHTPNALGDAQSVAGYASGISYQSNGAVAGYTLNNGISKKSSPPAACRRVPWRQADRTSPASPDIFSTSPDRHQP